MQSFVFDTYAILEIIDGNPNYEKFLNSQVIINDFIFAELCYMLIKEDGIEKANEYISKYQNFITELDADVIKDAMLFRSKNIKKNLSGTDCIGYIMARKLEIKFLTGDKEFENLENVEFVK